MAVMKGVAPNMIRTLATGARPSARTAAAATGAPRRESLLAFGFGWAENQVGAAVKSVPLGQSAGQRLLGALAQALPAVVDAALATATAGDAARQNLAPMLAILSARHEAQYSRLFRS